MPSKTPWPVPSFASSSSRSRKNLQPWLALASRAPSQQFSLSSSVPLFHSQRFSFRGRSPAPKAGSAACGNVKAFGSTASLVREAAGGGAKVPSAARHPAAQRLPAARRCPHPASTSISTEAGSRRRTARWSPNAVIACICLSVPAGVTVPLKKKHPLPAAAAPLPQSWHRCWPRRRARVFWASFLRCAGAHFSKAGSGPVCSFFTKHRGRSCHGRKAAVQAIRRGRIRIRAGAIEVFHWGAPPAFALPWMVPAGPICRSPTPSVRASEVRPCFTDPRPR